SGFLSNVLYFFSSTWLTWPPWVLSFISTLSFCSVTFCFLPLAACAKGPNFSMVSAETNESGKEVVEAASILRSVFLETLLSVLGFSKLVSGGLGAKKNTYTSKIADI